MKIITKEEQELEELEKTRELVKQEKEQTLQKLTVTTSTGKVFYADPESRVDLESAISTGIRKGLTETPWKLAEKLVGVDPISSDPIHERVYIVTLKELEDASELALRTKGSMVGAVQNKEK